MLLHDLNIGLLIGLGIVSWFGLCVWNALIACDANAIPMSLDSPAKPGICDSFIRHATAATVVEPQNITATSSNVFKLSEWLVFAALANAGVYFGYNCMKKRVGCISKNLSQLGVQFDDKFTALMEQYKTTENHTLTELKETDNVINSFRLAQNDVKDLIQLVLDAVVSIRPKSRLSSSNDPCIEPSVIPTNATRTKTDRLTLTQEQQINIERSLFYLEQIAEYFQKRVNDGHSLPEEKLCAVQSMGIARRSSPRSVRSDMILKRLSRELIQPIRKRYNDMYMMKAESLLGRENDVVKNVLANVQHPTAVYRKTRSATNAGKKSGKGATQLLRNGIRSIA